MLTDLTEDSTLVDGFLAQIHCLPCVPVNEMTKDKLQSYVMRAMSELGELASGVVSTERLTPARKISMIESINAGTCQQITELKLKHYTICELAKKSSKKTPNSQFLV